MFYSGNHQLLAVLKKKNAQTNAYKKQMTAT